MADNIRFKQGSLAALAGQSISNGTLWFTTDEAAIYLDANDKRVRFGDYITVERVSALPADGHAYESALYYAKEENILARWDKTNSKWVQLNAAGLSEITVTGNGNVLAGASVVYDAETGKKKLTFTTASVATSEGLETLQTKVNGLSDRMDKADAKLAGIEDGQTVTGLISAAQNTLQGNINTVSERAEKGITDAAAAKTYAEGVQTNLNTTNTKVSGIETDVNNLKAAVGEGGSVDEKIEDAIEGVIGASTDEAGAETIHGALKAAAAAQSAAEAAQGTANAADTLSKTNSTLISGLDGRLTTAEGEIDTLQAAVTLLNGTSTEAGSVAYQIAQVIDGAPESLDTLKEIADWIGSDTTGAAALNSRISDVESKNREQDTKLQGLESTINTNAGNATQAINDAKAELKGSAVDYTDLGKAETAIKANATAVAKAQEDATKGINDAAAAKTYAEGVNTKVTGLESALNAENTGLLARMTTAEGEIDALQQADIDMAAAYAAADAQVKTDLIGDATTYKTFGAAEDAIQKNAGDIATANTKINGLTSQLTWEVFQ